MNSVLRWNQVKVGYVLGISCNFGFPLRQHFVSGPPRCNYGLQLPYHLHSLLPLRTAGFPVRNRTILFGYMLNDITCIML